MDNESNQAPQKPSPRKPAQGNIDYTEVESPAHQQVITDLAADYQNAVKRRRAAMHPVPHQEEP